MDSSFGLLEYNLPISNLSINITSIGYLYQCTCPSFKEKGPKPKPKSWKFPEQLKPDGGGNQGEELQQTIDSEKSIISI